MPQPPNSNSEILWREIDTAFDNNLLTGVVRNSQHIDSRNFLEDAKALVLQHVRNALEQHNRLKINTTFNADFLVKNERAIKSINTKSIELQLACDLENWYEQFVVASILRQFEEFQSLENGWALRAILDLTINISKYDPARAGCKFTLPREISWMGAVIRMASDDEACFAWAVVAAISHARRRENCSSSYPHYASVLNLQGIRFPMSLNQITAFESLNPTISVDVYRIKDAGEYSIENIRRTNSVRNKHVDLLFLGDPESVTAGHFAWIKDLPRLLSAELNDRDARKHICDGCFRCYNSEEELNAHRLHCYKVNSCDPVLPSEDDKWLTFKNYERKERVPFVVYADLQCISKKGHNEDTPNIYRHHKVFSIAYYVHCTHDPSFSKYQFHRGTDCIAWFVRQLQGLSSSVESRLLGNASMANSTNEQFSEFRAATRCYICDKPFETANEPVPHHCRMTGSILGAAHSNCKRNYRKQYFIPVIFHNLSNSNLHFIIKEVTTAFEGRVDLSPVNEKKYILFKDVASTASDSDPPKYVKLSFIDSYNFLNDTLYNLAKLLNPNELRILKSEFRPISDNDFGLFTRKGIFPSEYVDSVEKLQDRRLPPRQAFRSSSTGEEISDDEYAHAIKVWQRFPVQTLGDYSDIYLKTNVLLLAEVFENFRRTFIHNYGLDPAHYHTIAGFSWDAMLKHTKIKLELLTDMTMFRFIQRGIRGGLSQCSVRYAKANNKYMESYDSSQPSSYLMFLDENNLYGWAMSEPLPREGFRWVQNVDSFDVSSIDADSPKGYILEVDLKYPKELHDAHADLPFCPTHREPPGRNTGELLLATLHDKERYIVHYRNLQQCMRHGLRVTKIHRVLEFQQSRWLKSYIELNTRFRIAATTSFEKKLYKLMNNSLYGKSIERVREHCDVRLSSTWGGPDGAGTLIAKPNFHSRSILAEDLVAVKLRKLEAKINQPVYVGMCILDLSKSRVYEFHYDYMYPVHGRKCRILYTDTDSLIYHIECEDIYEFIRSESDKFDTSNYEENNAYGIQRRNGHIPGLMKDENGGSIMTEFAGLRSKIYACRVAGKDDTIKAAGICSVVRRTITFDDYVRCLQNNREKSRTESSTVSELDEARTVWRSNTVLSSYNDKRYILPDSYGTLPWGHRRVPNQ